jgi:ribosomal protein S18 acetylase RimI-like enzyme
MTDAAEWRAMTAEDIPAVHELSDRVHKKYPERQDVLKEKFELFPKGCFALKATGENSILGYCFSHPWSDGAPPALNTFLETLTENPESYFIHDLAIHPSMRRRNLPGALVPIMMRIAKEIPVPRITLVAVNGSEPFWTRMGFARTDNPALQASSRKKYDESAVHMQLGVT